MTTQKQDGGTEARISAMPASARVIFFMLKRLRIGALSVTLPDGRRFDFGTAEKGQEAHIIVENMKFFRTLLRRGSMGFAESYMDGWWHTPDLSLLLNILNQNVDVYSQTIERNWLTNSMNKLIHRLRPNTRAGSKKNIHAHYDLGNDFYELWLDSTMTYSAARFSNSQMSLREAQNEKYRSLAQQAKIGPNDHVLEIGCGWGGFAEFAATEIGCQVTGITISNEQLEYARKRIEKAGLSDRVDLKFCDYRDVTEKYDRIVSIEMFEAVGENYWSSYFSQVKNCLKPGGHAGLQVITIANDRYATYRKSVDFIQRYIFPGGMLPSPKILYSKFNEAGLKLDRQIDFSNDYARTLAAWRHKFIDVWPEIQKLGFDTRFRNMWEYYLAYCEAGFSSSSIDVSHFVLSHK